MIFWLQLGEGCNTLLTSANASNVRFTTLYHCLKLCTSQSLNIRTCCIYTLACARLTLLMRTPSSLILDLSVPQPDLQTSAAHVATYRGIPLQTAEGDVRVKTLVSATIR